MAAGAPPRSFAERLQALGAEFDREVRSIEDSVGAAVRAENERLREEVVHLAEQLEAERRRHAAQLAEQAVRKDTEQVNSALTCRLTKQLEHAEQRLRQEMQAKDYWQQECATVEEKRDILEAKLAGALLTLEAEDQAYPRPGAEASRLVQEAPPPSWRRSSTAEHAPGGGSSPSSSTGGAASPGGYLRLLEASRDEDTEAAAEVELRLGQLPEDSFHSLLVAAAGRRGGAKLVQRVARSWLGRLLTAGGAEAMRAAVRSGSAETLAAVLSLGTAPAAVAAAALAAGQPGEIESVGEADCSAIEMCVKQGDVAMLGVLLENLRGAGQSAVDGVRRAYGAALAAGDSACLSALAGHLVVELSLLGNTRYRQGELEEAIGCYEEAIDLCLRLGTEDADAHGGARLGSQDFGGDAAGHGESQRNNLVRLRYNLARALHRTDRWAEAREQASKVLSLDPLYANAYALRAQAAMAAWDWGPAAADWRALLDIAEPGPGKALLPGAEQPSRESLAAWRKRSEECERQLSATHYEALDLPRLSGVEAVKRAYRDIARRWHPDKQRHRPEDHQERAKRRFARVREAYEVLSDDASKRAYDGKLLMVEARPLGTPAPHGQEPAPAAQKV